ncbi:hypothetical protein GOP47_0003137 [Adiantum capillus-veneris]|uniref:histidine kinase n=1 Tax=Adiantum capillus-veneris TaxID=13818 RepID=A0A9D4ZPT6_ADICA|nr:hypothetical protein GOP47_0003137 [Adiantum capillus-veneris]
MNHDLVSKRNSASASSCWPVSFLGYSPSPVRARAADTIFSYDLGLLCQEHAALDMPWATHGVSEDIGKNWTNEKKHADKNNNGKDDDENDDLQEEKKGCSRCCLLGCWRGNAATRSLCGVMCNPLLTSRLALMALLALLLIVMTVLTWVLTSTNVQHSVSLIASKFRWELLIHSKDNVDAVLHRSNTSSASLASFLASLKQGSLSSADSLHEQARPAMFLVFSILLKKTCVTYFGPDGLLLSYASDVTGTYLTYANVSYLSPNSSQAPAGPWRTGETITETRPWYQWYQQRVDDDTGYPVGETLTVPPVPFWDNEAVKASLQSVSGIASWVPSIVGSGEGLFSYLSPVRQRQFTNSLAVVSVGVPAPGISNLLNSLTYQGGAIFLATAEGQLVAQTGAGLPTIKVHNTSQPAGASNNALVAGAAKYLTPYLSYISTLEGKSFTVKKLEIDGAQYILDSAPLHLAGATVVCTVILPYTSIWGLTERWSHITIAVLVALATTMGIVGCFFVILLTKGVSNEMRLRAALIQQLEETKRAETKSNHKSLVFANMSHDLRTPLAAILGLIDLCLCDAPEFSELGSNLIQMKSCATNLLGILNSILDMSKIEAGKLLLQESEFDLVNALEEVIDTFSVVGLKKGIEVALDLSDGFVNKASWVIGDVGRVKQIMANLLSNGVKFTSEGHVVLRGWVKPLGVSGVRSQFGYRGKLLSWPWSQLIRSPSREKEIRKLIQGFSEQDHDENYIHVEFEVDDTGRGIPKERWKSVFENFVQVESSGPRNYDGTGLGLGIVRSLVRLMGGDINITDKDEPGEPGTRFRFDLIFKCKKQPAKLGFEEGAKQDSKLQNGASLQATFGVSADSVSPGWQLDNTGAFVFSNDPVDAGFNSPPIMEGVHVLLAMQGQAGKRGVKKWMERRGLQVWTIARWEEFMSTIESIRHEVFSPSFSTSERFDPRSPECHIYDSWVDDLDAKNFAQNESRFDTSLQGLPTSEGTGSAHKLNLYGPQAHLLLIIDVSMAAPTVNLLCSDLEDVLVEADQSLPFRVAWLVNANTPSSDIQFLRRKTKVCNLVLHKPLYASRLKCVWDLLQDLIGIETRDSLEAEAPHMLAGNREKVDLSAANSLYTSLSCMSTFHQDARSLQLSLDMKRGLGAHSGALATGNLSDVNSLPSSVTVKSQTKQQMDASHITVSEKKEENLSLTPENVALRSSENTMALRNRFQNALSNMHILVAEDNAILQRLTKTQLIRLGATVECVDNGAEAARLVLENLYRSKVSSPEGTDGKLSGESALAEKNHPFNLVLMDCEMPILNGYEATQRIRSEESRYGIRTPVIALTAHAMAQDEKKCIEAGMDFYLTKPLAIGALLDVVSKLSGKNLEVT